MSSFIVVALGLFGFVVFGFSVFVAFLVCWFSVIKFFTFVIAFCCIFSFPMIVISSSFWLFAILVCIGSSLFSSLFMMMFITSSGVWNSWRYLLSLFIVFSLSVIL